MWNILKDQSTFVWLLCLFALSSDWCRTLCCLCAWLLLSPPSQSEESRGSVRNNNMEERSWWSFGIKRTLHFIPRPCYTFLTSFTHNQIFTRRLLEIKQKTYSYRCVQSLADACSMFVLKKEPYFSCSKKSLSSEVQEQRKERSEPGSPEHLDKHKQHRFKILC